MFEPFVKATIFSFHKGMTFCHSINVKKVMKLLAFIFEQPSYLPNHDFIRYSVINKRSSVIFSTRTGPTYNAPS